METLSNKHKSLHLQTKGLLSLMGEKYDVEPSNILIGIYLGDLVVRSYYEGSTPEWQVLEVIKIEEDNV